MAIDWDETASGDFDVDSDFERSRTLLRLAQSFGASSQPAGSSPELCENIVRAGQNSFEAIAKTAETFSTKDIALQLGRYYLARAEKRASGGSEVAVHSSVSSDLPKLGMRVANLTYHVAKELHEMQTPVDQELKSNLGSLQKEFIDIQRLMEERTNTPPGRMRAFVEKLKAQMDNFFTKLDHWDRIFKVPKKFVPMKDALAPDPPAPTTAKSVGPVKMAERLHLHSVVSHLVRSKHN